MALGSASLSRLALWLWVGWICFSSSGAAGRWANVLYDAFFAGVASSGFDGRFFLQKSYHAFLFSVLGILTTLPARARSVWACIAICVAVSAGAEALQLFAAHRTPTWADVGLNVAASLAALGISLGRRDPRAFA